MSTEGRYLDLYDALSDILEEPDNDILEEHRIAAIKALEAARRLDPDAIPRADPLPATPAMPDYSDERPHVIRWVPTHVGKDGLRTLVREAQGRATFSTRAKAQAWLDALVRHNSRETLEEFYGAPPLFEVRPCRCYPGHHDPMGIYFD